MRQRMMCAMSSLLLIFCLSFSLSSSSRSPSQKRRSETSNNEELIKQRLFLNQAHLQFTLDLMASLLIDNFNPENTLLTSFAFSPLSLQSTLMMMQLGTKGLARREISNALYLSQITDSENSTFTTAHELYGESVKSLLEDPNVIKNLNIANQVFVQKNLIPSSAFELSLRHYHSSRLRPIDFESPNFVDIINSWIEKETKGTFANLLSSSTSPSSAIYLMAINAMYFKGDWLYKFNELDTEINARFYKTNKQVDSVNMMLGKIPIGYTYNPELKTTLIELPYRVQRLGMFLLLPDDISGVFSLMRSLNSTTFTSLIASMRKDPNKEGVNVRLPKFELESSPRMTNILKNNLGIRSLFSNAELDLSNMFLNPPPNMHVEDIIHKVNLKVDEKGTIAAAVTATVIERVGSFTGSYFEADHPFMYFLTDKQTGLILFAGVYAGPPPKPQN